MRIDALFDPIYAQLEKVLDLRSEQHSMLSSNLANANTPNYRAKNLDFSEVLSEVMDTPSAHLKMNHTHGNHQNGLFGVEALPPVVEQEPPPWSLDGNSVNPEQELVKVMENNVHFDAITRATSRKLAQLRAAVNEGR